MTDRDARAFAEEVLAFRRRKKLTQKAAGAVFGVGYLTVWRWEAGRTTPDALRKAHVRAKIKRAGRRKS